MRRLVLAVVALAALLAILLVSAGHGEARCGFICLNRQIKGLRHQFLPTRMRRIESRLDAQDQYIVWLEERAQRAEDRLAKFAAFEKCFGEVPLTRYGEELGPSGYLFKLEGLEGPLTLATTALDVAYPGDPVGTWAFVNTCNSDRLMPQSGPVRQSTVPIAHFYEP